jgi:hypothetical protein
MPLTDEERRSLTDTLLERLRGQGAHADFEHSIRGLPPEQRGTIPHGLPYSPWMLLEHLRISQWDILEFSRRADHVSPEWPDGYWPEGAAPPDEGAWDRAVEGFERDLAAMQALVSDPAADLFTPLSWGTGQTLFREATLLSDHNAYHLGQLVAVRRLLGSWPPGD